MIWVFLIGLLLVATAVAGVWYAVTRTDYIPKLVVYLVKLALPVIIDYIMKRKDPVLESLWRQAVLQGQEWDHRTNKPKDPR
mgnify:CR=1 FL=1